MPEPWGARGHVVYHLSRAGGQWRLGGYGSASVRVAQGWPHDVPLPAGYLPAPPVPAADPAALRAVRAAAAAWAAAPASRIAVEQTADGKDGPATLIAEVTAAPARGDAHGDTTGDSEVDETLWLDRGIRVLDRTGNGSRWTEHAGTDPADFGVVAPTNPFAVVALLADADAAAPVRCPAGLMADACFTAAVATADPAVPLSANTNTARRAGLPWLVLDIGLDRQGLPAFVRVCLQAIAFGEPYSRLVSTAVFTAYPNAPPPPVAEPDPSDVALDNEDQQ